uniref:Uncharacterized protein n=1 Tax=Caenorhabditis japonica TaxID=281687 RepID=A0A8R1ILI8_CAEJA
MTSIRPPSSFVFWLCSMSKRAPSVCSPNPLDDAEQLMSKRGIDKCGCNLGCFYSSARDCMSCCALAL